MGLALILWNGVGKLYEIDLAWRCLGTFLIACAGLRLFRFFVQRNELESVADRIARKRTKPKATHILSHQEQR